MTAVEIVQIQVPAELAERLRPYQDELPRILEQGLSHIEAESVSETMTLQKLVVAALHQAGIVGPNPEEVARYLAGRENQRWMPIQAGGKPASEIIVEERDSRAWARS